MDSDQEHTIEEQADQPSHSGEPSAGSPPAGETRRFPLPSAEGGSSLPSDEDVTGYPRIQEEALLPGEQGTRHYLARVADERRQTLKQLRRQLNFTRALTESLGEGVYALDANGRVTFVNSAAERMLGWRETELLGRDMHETIHFRHADGSVFPEAECPLVAVIRSGEMVRCDDDVFVRKDGSLLPIAYVSAPVISDGQITGTVLAFHDISERKRAERRLRLQYDVSSLLVTATGVEEVAEALVGTIGEALDWGLGALWLVEESVHALRCAAIWHAPGVGARVFEAATRHIALAKGSGVPGRVWETDAPLRVDDVSRENNFPRLPSARAAGLHSAFAFPVRGDRAILGVLEFYATHFGLPDDELPRTAAALGHQVGQYIEERRAEEAQRASEARLHGILEAAPDCVISMDAEGRATEFNPAAERTFGYTREQALGHPIAELIIPPDLRERHYKGLARYLETGEERVLGKRLELRGMRADGAEFPLEMTITRIWVPGPPVFTAHLRDISDQVRAEEERTSLLQRERRARAEAETAATRLRALQSITEVGLAHLSLDDLLGEMLGRVRDVLQLDGVTILLVAPDGEHLVVRAAIGLDAEVEPGGPIPIGRGIAGRIAATRQPLVIDDLARAETVRPYLHVASRSLIGVPLEIEGRIVGVIQGSTHRRRHFTAAETQLLRLVADRVAVALDRARLFEEERTAHEAAERAQRRFEFLAEAGTVLASSLEYEHSLTQLAWLVVPELADACYVDLLEEDGSIQRLAIAHRDPEKLRILEDIRARRPLETAEQHPILQVLRTGESRLMSEIPWEVFVAASGDDEETIEGLRRLGYRSGLAVPLLARGWIFGALTILAGESGRVYGPDDLALAEDLGRRVGLAVENARLFRQTQRALHRVEEIADELLMQATQLDAVIEAIPGVVFVSDARGYITKMNPSGAAMLGLELHQTPWPNPEAGTDSVFSPDGAPLSPEEYPLAQALRGEMRTDFLCMMHRFDTGEEVQLLVSFAPIRDGTGAITGAVAVGNDVTTIHRLQEQKDEFLSIASHELKTPLTSLKILAQLTRRRLTRAGAKEAEQLAGMERSIERMERLVNDLLDVSRIQAGKLALRLERFDLVALCRQVADEQSAATDRAIALSLPEGPVRAEADPERIGQVLTNLLSNALKYSPPGCPVSLTVRAEEARQAHVVVRDEGGGIPPELQEHLFERFYRVPGVQVQSGSGVGLGLGLYISREIIERHHGRIWVESDVGEGAAFHFTFPLDG